MINSVFNLTAAQNQHLAVLQARAKARAEYKKQGICTDLFYDDFVADCACDHCKRYRSDTLRFNSVSFPSDELPY
jgi:hypothetical protein